MRGQISIELLLAGVLFTAFILLSLNYVGSFKESVSLAAGHANSAIIASQLSQVANAVCVSRANTSFRLSCPPQGFVAIGGQGAPLLNVSAGSGQFVNASVACRVNNSIAFSCSPPGGEWVCFEYVNAELRLKQGRC